MFAAFLIRELDYFLDFYLMDNLWQVLCAILLSVAAVYCARNHYRFSQGWRRSWPSAGLALIIGGLILLIPFAQLVGHEATWRSVMGDSYLRIVKVASEEFIELGAYAIITMGTIGIFFIRGPRPPHVLARSLPHRNDAKASRRFIAWLGWVRPGRPLPDRILSRAR